MMRIALIDYGSGNLRSAQKSVEKAAHDNGLKCEAVLASHAEDIARADRIILPGVGAFKDCMQGLSAIPGMREALQEQVIGRGKPFLGVCVGMQLLATQGVEHEVTKGLGWVAGDVTAIVPDDASLKVPHMGWNTLDVKAEHPLFDGIVTGDQGLHAYFVHSYQLQTILPEDVLATTDYGGPITAAVAYDNIVGTQFHPEKSQKLGLRFLANFLRWKP